MINYNYITSEFSWIEVSEELFLYFLNSINKNLLKTIKIKINEELFLNIGFDDIKYQKTLQEKFYCSPMDEGSLPLNLIYIKRNNEINTTNSVGLICKKTKQCIAFGTGDGKLKSLISSLSGFNFFRNTYYPLHASIISINNKWIAIVGGRNIGKTTSVFEALKHYKNSVNILCDDWSFASSSNGKIKVTTFDRSISYDNTLIQKYNLKLPLIDSTNYKKSSITPEKICKQTKVNNEIYLDMIIGLIPCQGKNKLFATDCKSMSEHIIKSAYHYPYVNKNLIEKHRIFWNKNMISIPTFFFPVFNEQGTFNEKSDIFKELF